MKLNVSLWAGSTKDCQQIDKAQPDCGTGGTTRWPRWDPLCSRRAFLACLALQRSTNADGDLPVLLVEEGERL